MARDLFEERGIAIDQPQTDGAPRDLLQGMRAKDWMQRNDPNASMEFLKNLPANIVTGLAQGGHGMLNAPSNIAQYEQSKFPTGTLASMMGLDAKDIPRQKEFDYPKATFGMFGRPESNTLTDKLVRELSKFAPYGIGAAASLPAAAGRLAAMGAQAGAGAMYGATQTAKPEDVGKEAAFNALFGGATEAFPGAYSAVKSYMKARSPEGLAKSLADLLGGKSTNLEQNAKSLSSDIRDAHKSALKEYKSEIDPIMNKHGEDTIYTKIDPVEEFKTKGGRIKVSDALKLKPYYDMPKYNLESSNRRLNELFSEYKEKPTVNNAHILQSEIYKEIQSLKDLGKRGGMDVRNQVHDLNEIREGIKKDIGGYLDSQSKITGKKYKGASDIYKEKVAPFYADRTLEKIAKGQETNPKNVHNIFEYPTEKITYSGSTQQGDIEKVLNALPESSKNKILYSKVGGHQKVSAPKRLVAEMNKAQQGGYSSIYNPQIEKMVSHLSSKLKMTPKNDNQMLTSLIKEIVGSPVKYGSYAVNNPLTRLMGKGAAKAYKYSSPLAIPTLEALEGNQ